MNHHPIGSVPSTFYFRSIHLYTPRFVRFFFFYFFSLDLLKSRNHIYIFTNKLSRQYTCPWIMQHGEFDANWMYIYKEERGREECHGKKFECATGFNFQ